MIDFGEPEELVQIELDRADDEAVQVIRRGPQEMRLRTAAVKIRVTGARGSVIEDILSRDQFFAFVHSAKQVLGDA